MRSLECMTLKRQPCSVHTQQRLLKQKHSYKSEDTKDLGADIKHKNTDLQIRV